MFGVLWAVGKWIVEVAVSVTLWAVAHPIVALTVGTTLVVAADWLSVQPWAGADILARVVHAFGLGVLVTGIGAWVGLKIIGVAPAIGRVVGAVASWWLILSRSAPIPFLTQRAVGLELFGF